MGSFEYYHTSFSYTIEESGRGAIRRRSRARRRDLISLDPLPPGSVTRPALHADGTVGHVPPRGVRFGRHRQTEAGGRRCGRDEGVDPACLQPTCRRTRPTSAIDVISTSSDLHVEVIDLLANRVEAEMGVAFFVCGVLGAPISPVRPALLVLGDMSIQGNIKPLRSLTEPLQVANGQRRQASADSHREQAEFPRRELQTSWSV